MLDTGGDGDARLKFAASTPEAFPINAWVKIAPDGHVTFAVHRSEMGQGITTSLPMLLAEELDADWERVSYEFAPIDKDYFNFGVMGRGRPLGEIEGRPLAALGTAVLRRMFHARGDDLTLSSTSIIDAWDSLRPAGASARLLLVAAAARRWQVPAEELRTERGHVLHPASGRSAHYGELAADASGETVAEDPRPKDPATYSIVGTSPRRLDIPEKVRGAAQFGIDVVLPDMLHGTVVHSAVAGGRIAAFDAVDAKSVPGVEAVLALGDVAVAVLARDSWTARRAAEKLRIEAVEPDRPVDSATLHAQYLAALDDPEPAVFREDGDALKALQGAAAVTTATYQWPYLAHACMEPMNCTALYADGQLTVWAPSQALTTARQVAATTAGIDPAQVRMHRTLIGGGFGRRAEMDFVERAVAAAMQVPGRAVKISYTREEDTRHDMYRPAGVSRISAAVTSSGLIQALDYRLATQSVVASFAVRTPSPRPGDARRDNTVATGVYDLIYPIPNLRVAYVPQDNHLPVGYWRSTATSYGAFCIESFMDELAHSAGLDPVAFRLANLPPDSRHRGVLQAAAERSGWGTPLAPGRGRGIALFEKARTVIAQVAEVTADAAGGFSVDRIVCVVDPGSLVHPDTVVAMMQGGIVYGLNASLYGEITVREGRVTQGNFNDLPQLAIGELPAIEVHLLPQGGRPEGVGETAVPGVAPAVANAIFAATGVRLRQLPLGRVVAA